MSSAHDAPTTPLPWGEAPADGTWATRPAPAPVPLPPANAGAFDVLDYTGKIVALVILAMGAGGMLVLAGTILGAGIVIALSPGQSAAPPAEAPDVALFVPIDPGGAGAARPPRPAGAPRGGSSAGGGTP